MALPNSKRSGETRVSKKDIKVLNLLTDIAREVDPVSAARIAAAIVYKGQVISVGINKRKTDPFQAKYCRNAHQIFVHAEIAAIKNSLRHLSLSELENSTLFVARHRLISYKGQGLKEEWGLAKPCVGSKKNSGCMGAIQEFNIHRIVYTLDGHGKYAEEMI